MAVRAAIDDEGVDAVLTRVPPIVDLPENPAAALGTGLELPEWNMNFLLSH